MSVKLLNSTLCRSGEFMLTLYISHIQLLLEFGSWVWNFKYISDMKLLENLQRRWTKRIDDFENLTYSQRLKDFNLFSVEGGLPRADVIKYWKIFYSMRNMSGGYISFKSKWRYSWPLFLNHPWTFFTWM